MSRQIESPVWKMTRCIPLTKKTQLVGRSDDNDMAVELFCSEVNIEMKEPGWGRGEASETFC
jgi:hypothetical protein